MTSYECLKALAQILFAEGHSVGACERFTAECVGLLARMNKVRDQARLDEQALVLLPRGANIAAEAQNCHRVTAYRRAKRGLKLLRDREHSATAI